MERPDEKRDQAQSCAAQNGRESSPKDTGHPEGEASLPRPPISPSILFGTNIPPQVLPRAPQRGASGPLQVRAAGPPQRPLHTCTHISQTPQGHTLCLRTKPPILRWPTSGRSSGLPSATWTRENTEFLKSDRPGFESQMRWLVASRRHSRNWSASAPRTADLTPGTPGPLFLPWAAYTVVKRTDSGVRFRGSNLTSYSLAV